EDGADPRWRLQPLPAAAPQRQGHRCGDGFAALHRRAGSRQPPARAEGGDEDAGRPLSRPPQAPPPHPEIAPMTAPSRSNDIVLAFSGGLDTSFCVPWLKERGWNVHTV